MIARGLAAVAALLLAASGLWAQEGEPHDTARVEQAQTTPMLQRESFSYSGAGRRDPRPL